MLPVPITTRKIVAARGPKNVVDPHRPYAFLVEDERSRHGVVEPVATLFLTNRECPFRCLFCDLWKNTTDEQVPIGAIPEQIAFALARLPAARHIKLYNSGNFFDPLAIPTADHPRIAELVRGYDTVIVENHPRMTDERCLPLNDMLDGELEIALGLETIHPQVLASMNKGMTVADFDRAVAFLGDREIATRAFILLRPPFMSEAEGLEWAIRSIEHAFAQGVRVCSVIPTRGGNGMMEQLRQSGHYSPPSLRSMEQVMEAGLALGQGRVLIDLWDAQRFAANEPHAVQRIARLAEMNHTQTVKPTKLTIGVGVQALACPEPPQG